MTSILTSSRAPLSTLNAPLTQNTAPVIEHRCLYTHDLRRKQKRWQDGFLKFHTFNKRVMVYDVPRNYIGDTHWRDKDPVQDGDEVELDRGILIQVGEILGSVEQDLTELLEKRKKAPEVLVNETLPSLAPAASLIDLDAVGRAKGRQSTHSQRPRPLTALLGTPRGPIGRAAFSTVSPHEKRVHRDQIERSKERIAKRQRRDNVPPEWHLAVHREPIALNPIPNEESVVLDGRTTKKATGDGVSNASNYDTTYGRCFPPFSKPSRKLGAPGGRNEVSTENVCEQVESESLSTEPSIKSKKTKAKQPRAARQVTRVHNLQNPVKTPSGPTSSLANNFNHVRIERDTTKVISNGDYSDGDGEARVRMRLQMASRKPRKKLMYRDLVHSDVLLVKLQQNGLSQESLSLYHEKEMDGIEVRLKKQSTKRRPEHNANTLTSADNQEKQASSNLNQDLGVSFRRHHKTKRKSSPINEEDQCTNPRSSPSPSIEEIESPIPRAISTFHNTNNALSKMDEILLSRTHQPLAPSRKISKTTKSKPPTREDLLATMTTTPPQNVFRSTNAPTKPTSLATVSRDNDVCNPIELSAPALKTQVPSSPDFQTQSPFPNLERPLGSSMDDAGVPAVNKAQQSTNTSVIDHDVVVESSQPVAQDHINNLIDTATAIPMSQTRVAFGGDTSISVPQTEPSEEIHALAPIDPPEPVNKSLPSFKQPTRRSPLKKVISDMSSTSSRPLALIGAPVAAMHTRSKISPTAATEQDVNPWSIEAWDLFGCGRNGLECRFGEFVVNEGLG